MKKKFVILTDKVKKIFHKKFCSYVGRLKICRLKLITSTYNKLYCKVFKFTLHLICKLRSSRSPKRKLRIVL